MSTSGRVLAALVGVALLLAAGPLLGVGVVDGVDVGASLPPGDAALASLRPEPRGTTTHPQPGLRDLEGLQRTLDGVARAFAAADPGRLRRWLAEPGGEFGRRWLQRARNLEGVPLAGYELRVDRRLPDLATAAVRARHRAPVQVVTVLEEHTLRGFDGSGPATEDLYLTLVERGDRWLVAGDSDAARLGLASAEHLWDRGPVEATRRGPVLALHHPGTVDAEALAAATRRALDVMVGRWPLEWAGRVPVIIPRDEAELQALLRVSFDVSRFVAFATGTPVGELGEHRVTGSRVVLNPTSFRRRSPAVQQQILVHELAHVATRPVTGPLVPAWLEEGVAQALGEGASTTGTGLLEALPAAERRLPHDDGLTIGSQEEISLGYQLAYGFVEHLRVRHGARAVAAFYREAGIGAVGEPGNVAWHLERAARAAFDAPLAGLVASWRASR